MLAVLVPISIGVASVHEGMPFSLAELRDAVAALLIVAMVFSVSNLAGIASGARTSPGVSGS